LEGGRNARSIFDRFVTGVISRPLVETRSPIRGSITDPGYHHPPSTTEEQVQMKEKKKEEKKRKDVPPL
jgi:hypothetical protein